MKDKEWEERGLEFNELYELEHEEEYKFVYGTKGKVLTKDSGLFKMSVPFSSINLGIPREKIWQDIFDERLNQIKRWGEQDLTHPEWSSILGEEFGEACQAANDAYFPYQLAYGGGDTTKLRHELVQVIAVAVAWIQNIDWREDLVKRAVEQSSFPQETGD